MKISNSNINLIQQAYGKNTDIKSAKQTGETTTNPQKHAVDSVVLSTTTKDLQKVSASIDTQPQGRARKIANLKLMVEQGEYTVDPKKVAEKMMGTFLNVTS